MAPAILIMLLKYSGTNNQSILGVLVFSISVFLMYTSSTIYHWVLPGKLKRILRYFDHINIYVLIAASYTPILLCAIGGTIGWIMLTFLWSMVIFGSFYKVLFLNKYPRLSLGIYLAMGWSIVFIAVPLWNALPAAALWWLVAEGFFYTTGSYFYAHDSKHSYFHAIWHLFVLGGTISHFAVVWCVL